MVLLVHDDSTDSTTVMSEGVVGGERTPTRRYLQEGKYLVIEGVPSVVAHDVEQLQQLGFRLASAAEQSTFAKRNKQASSIVETTDEVKE